MIEPKPAATVILARDNGNGYEVLLLQRTHEAVFMPGVYVFPGGAVDDADRSPDLAALVDDLDDAAANRMLGVERGGLSYLLAAIRECFEEAGLLLAGGPLQDIDLDGWRDRVGADAAQLAELCRSRSLRLHAAGLAYLSHWITPPGPPRRYDTRFFVARAPAGQEARHDGQETVNHLWIAPGEALERNRRGLLPLRSPTIRTLRTLARFGSTAEVMAHAHGPAPKRELPSIDADGRDGARQVHPGDPQYAEVAKLAAEGAGTPGYEIIPGVVTRLSARIRRLPAPNPSVMTGPGTNTYLVDGGGRIAVIDPGPAIDEHVERIVRAASGEIRWILATHTHPDHSPAVRELKARTGAEVLGMPPPAGESQDQSFQPDRVLRHDERVDLGDCALRAIHTPGHASNHLCYLLEEEQTLFSGDHVMQGSTVVINPPDGHMGDYLRSLDALHGEDIAYIAPGHGFLLGEPYQVVNRIISHRQAREAKVMEGLRQLGEADEQALLRAVYDDVPEALHRVASRSLLAHLIKLEDDGLIERRGDYWTFSA